MGTDAGVYPHGDNPKHSLDVNTMSPMQAIQAATKVGAEALGIEKTVGQIAPGYSADIIAVAADPLADVSSLEHVGFVMKEGTLYKRQPCSCTAISRRLPASRGPAQTLETESRNHMSSDAMPAVTRETWLGHPERPLPAVRHRDVGARQLLRHARAAGAVAGGRRRDREPRLRLVAVARRSSCTACSPASCTSRR